MKKVSYEIDLSVIMDKTVREVERIDYEVISHNGSAASGVDQKVAIASMYMWKQIRHLRFTDKGTMLTIKEFLDARRLIADEFIHIHRLSYLVYRVVLDMYDYLEDKGRVTQNVKKYWKKVERVFYDYQQMHRLGLEKHTWVTVQDHMRLSSDLVIPIMPSLETTARDYLIQKRKVMLEAGQMDDITLLTKVSVCLLFCAALRNTRDHFFSDAIAAYGVDFSSDFKYSDISKMTQNFVWMIQQLGVKFTRDSDGDYVITGASVSDSVRVNSVWNEIVAIMTDPDMQDQTAVDAINMNPKSKEEFDRTIAASEKKELDMAIGNLCSKFKVGRI
jgi:hypothetical protein